MRRSAAPSLRVDMKRARFLPEIMKTNPFIDKENASESLTETNNVPNVPLSVIDTTNGTEKSPEIIRSNKDVLDIIFEADSTVPEAKNCADKISSSKEKHALHSSEKNSQKSLNIKPLKTNSSVISLHSNSNEDFNERMSNCIFCVKDVGEATLFSVVWCKRSGKKHKTWEGDGFLIVRSRSAVLKDLNGKILDKGVGYKLKETESLEEGSKFFIGGKECEIQCKISHEECDKYCNCNPASNISTQSTVEQPENITLVSTRKPC